MNKHTLATLAVLLRTPQTVFHAAAQAATGAGSACVCAAIALGIPQLQAQESSQPAWAIGPFTRVQDGHPILSPNANSVFDCPLSKVPVHWEKAWVYNPAAVVKDGKIVVLYRAQQGPGNSCSRIGYAESEDGTISRLSQPRCCSQPRILRKNGNGQAATGWADAKIPGWPNRQTDFM